MKQSKKTAGRPMHHERHGWSRTPEYRVWQGMLDRCYNPNNSRYQRYGGRGILVCEEWRLSFAAFIESLGRRPSPKHSLERKDNDGHYEPENCCWATPVEQARNNSRNRRFAYKGELLTITELSRQSGLGFYVIRYRLLSGWPIELAMTRPVQKQTRRQG